VPNPITALRPDQKLVTVNTWRGMVLGFESVYSRFSVTLD